MSGYAKMKNAELEAMCKERGLVHSGKKADLVKRLEEADAAAKTAVPAATAPKIDDDEIIWDDDEDLETAKAATTEPAAAAIAAGGTGQVANPRAVPNQVVGENVTGVETVGAPGPIADAPDAMQVEEKVTAKEQTAEEKAAQDAKREADYTAGVKKTTIDSQIEAIEQRATKFGQLTEEAKKELEALKRQQKFRTGGTAATEENLDILNGALNDKREKRERKGRKGGADKDSVQSGRVEKKGRPGAGSRQNSGQVKSQVTAKASKGLAGVDQAAIERRRARFAQKSEVEAITDRTARTTAIKRQQADMDSQTDGPGVFDC